MESEYTTLQAWRTHISKKDGVYAGGSWHSQFRDIVQRGRRKQATLTGSTNVPL